MFFLIYLYFFIHFAFRFFKTPIQVVRVTDVTLSGLPGIDPSSSPYLTNIVDNFRNHKTYDFPLTFLSHGGVEIEAVDQHIKTSCEVKGGWATCNVHQKGPQFFCHIDMIPPNFSLSLRSQSPPSSLQIDVKVSDAKESYVLKKSFSVPFQSAFIILQSEMSLSTTQQSRLLYIASESSVDVTASPQKYLEINRVDFPYPGVLVYSISVMESVTKFSWDATVTVTNPSSGQKEVLQVTFSSQHSTDTIESFLPAVVQNDEASRSDPFEVILSYTLYVIVAFLVLAIGILLAYQDSRRDPQSSSLLTKPLFSPPHPNAPASPPPYSANPPFSPYVPTVYPGSPAPSQSQHPFASPYSAGVTSPYVSPRRPMFGAGVASPGFFSPGREHFPAPNFDPRTPNGPAKYGQHGPRYEN